MYIDNYMSKWAILPSPHLFCHRWKTCRRYICSIILLIDLFNWLACHEQSYLTEAAQSNWSGWGRESHGTYFSSTASFSHVRWPALIMWPGYWANRPFSRKSQRESFHSFAQYWCEQNPVPLQVSYSPLLLCLHHGISSAASGPSQAFHGQPLKQSGTKCLAWSLSSEALRISALAPLLCSGHHAASSVCKELINLAAADPRGVRVVSCEVCFSLKRHEEQLKWSRGFAQTRQPDRIDKGFTERKATILQENAADGR